MEQVLLNGAVLGANYALMALGLTLIFAIMGVINFAHGQMYVLGGFVTYYIVVSSGLPYIVGIAGSIAVLAILGFLLDRLLFAKASKASSREENTMLLAAGIALLIESVILMWFGEKQRGVPPMVSGVYDFGGALVPTGRLAVFAIAILAIIVFIVFMHFTKLGRALRAIAQDKEVTALQGVNVGMYSGIGFAIGAALAGLAGSLLVTIFAVNSGMGNAVSIKAFIMVMLGGAGVVSGAILGGFVLGVIEALGYAYLPNALTYLFIYFGIVAFLMFRPHGIMGKPWG